MVVRNVGLLRGIVREAGADTLRVVASGFCNSARQLMRWIMRQEGFTYGNAYGELGPGWSVMSRDRVPWFCNRSSMNGMYQVHTSVPFGRLGGGGLREQYPLGAILRSISCRKIPPDRRFWVSLHRQGIAPCGVVGGVTVISKERGKLLITRSDA